MEKHGHQPTDKLDTSNPPGKEVLSNPAAFPKITEFREGYSEDGIYEYGEPGMALLDYAAIKYASSMLAIVYQNPDSTKRFVSAWSEKYDGKTTVETCIAKDAYRLAKALLIERQKHI